MISFDFMLKQLISLDSLLEENKTSQTYFFLNALMLKYDTLLFGLASCLCMVLHCIQIVTFKKIFRFM